MVSHEVALKRWGAWRLSRRFGKEFIEDTVLVSTEWNDGPECRCGTCLNDGSLRAEIWIAGNSVEGDRFYDTLDLASFDLGTVLGEIAAASGGISPG